MGENGRVSTTFPSSKRSKRGYDPDEVDEFLDRARAAYAQDSGKEPVLTAEDIRHVAFRLSRGGYSTEHVDAALERLEDAFSLRERERTVEERGAKEWLREARGTAQVILNRLTRPEGQRFDRVSFLSRGYSKKDVDALADRLVAYFHDGTPLSVDRVRTAVFRNQWAGYRESQVDALLDSVVDVMLAVR
ncbi:DivIVA domain-containing protein [Plantibacter sp. RU18]